jgi:hypothetical protein
VIFSARTAVLPAMRLPFAAEVEQLEVRRNGRVVL